MLGEWVRESLTELGKNIAFGAVLIAVTIGLFALWIGYGPLAVVVAVVALFVSGLAVIRRFARSR